MLERRIHCYRFPDYCGVLFMSMFAILLGCSDEVAVREYTVAKRKNVGTAQVAGAAVEQQILGVIIPHGETAWYFKMMDEPQKLAKYEADFREIVKNVRFEASGEPQFQLAEGWSKEDVRSIIYARLKREGDDVSATVTQLPAPTMDEASWRDRVIEDVNRWRGQVSLSRVDWERMEPDLEEVAAFAQGNAKAYFVSLVGKKAPGGMGSAPFMNQFGGQPTDKATSPPQTVTDTDAKPAGPKLTYNIPTGWSEQPASGIRQAVFEVDDGQGEPLSVIVSTASVKPELMVDMWMEQLGIEATEEAKQKVAEKTTTESVNEVTATLYELSGSAGESILVAQIPWTGNESLFVKLTGKTERIVAQRDAFLQLVKSMKW